MEDPQSLVQPEQPEQPWRLQTELTQLGELPLPPALLQQYALQLQVVQTARQLHLEDLQAQRLLLASRAELQTQLERAESLLQRDPDEVYQLLLQRSEQLQLQVAQTPAEIQQQQARIETRLQQRISKLEQAQACLHATLQQQGQHAHSQKLLELKKEAAELKEELQSVPQRMRTKQSDQLFFLQQEQVWVAQHLQGGAAQLHAVIAVHAEQLRLLQQADALQWHQLQWAQEQRLLLSPGTELQLGLLQQTHAALDQALRDSGSEVTAAVEAAAAEVRRARMLCETTHPSPAQLLLDGPPGNSPPGNNPHGPTCLVCRNGHWEPATADGYVTLQATQFVLNGNASGLAMLIKNNAISVAHYVPLSAGSPYWVPLLHYAAAYGSLEVVDALLASGADPDAPHAYLADGVFHCCAGDGAVQFALLKNTLQVTERLLVAGTVYKGSSEKRARLLNRAASEGRADLFLLCLRHGAFVNEDLLLDALRGALADGKWRDPVPATPAPDADFAQLEGVLKARVKGRTMADAFEALLATTPHAPQAELCLGLTWVLDKLDSRAKSRVAVLLAAHCCSLSTRPVWIDPAALEAMCAHSTAQEAAHARGTPLEIACACGNAWAIDMLLQMGAVLTESAEAAAEAAGGEALAFIRAYKATHVLDFQLALV